MADPPAEDGTVFISYSHQDAGYLTRLQMHLAPYVRSGAIPLWDDTQIKPGDDWMRSIERALNDARVALLLVSVSFLASEFVSKEELPRLLAAQARGARILPVVLTPCSFRRSPLSIFQAVNDPARPLSRLRQHTQDQVWEDVVSAVLDALNTPSVPLAASQALRIEPALEPLVTLIAQHSQPEPISTAPASASERSLPEPATEQPSGQQGMVQFTCMGHLNVVKSVGWAPDGTKLASASDDATVRIWNAVTGEEIIVCQGHLDSVSSVAWAPDGTKLASVGADKKVHVWDAASGQRLVICEGHTGRVNSVAWSPDGRWLASASNDRTVRLWEAGSGQQHMIFNGRGYHVNSVAWSPDGTKLASAGDDEVIEVWKVSSGRLLVTYQASRDTKRLDTVMTADGMWEYDENPQPQFQQVYSIAWSPDGARLASASNDGSIHVWAATNGKELFAFKVYEGFVRSVAWSPDGTRLASASDAGLAKVWEASRGTQLLTCRIPNDTPDEPDEDDEEEKQRPQVYGVAWSPDGKRLASASDDGAVWVWDVG